MPAERAPYPLDVLHLRVQGTIADNAAPSPIPARIARAWNERYAFPELRTATNREFFEALPQDDLETFTGDWADWWADGLGSSARAIGFNRRAQAAVRTGQTLAVLSGSTVDADAAYERIALFDEHTWGAAHPRGEAESGRESGRRAMGDEGRARDRRARVRGGARRRRGGIVPHRSESRRRCSC